jgi:hypothetical protein
MALIMRTDAPMTEQWQEGNDQIELSLDEPEE